MPGRTTDEWEHADTRGERHLFDLTGKVAVVTGGGSGLGRVICDVLAEYGANVACVGRSPEKLQATLDGIAGHGGHHLAVSADVREQAEIENVVRTVTAELGGIDVFFANAGIREKSFVLIHEKPVGDWDDVLDADLRAVFLQMRAVLPVMMERGGGSFVTTSSVGGMWPLTQDRWIYTQTAYAVAKAGLVMLTKVAARQYGSFGIRVNTICPGYHRTPLTPEHEIAEVERTLARLLPLGRCGMPEEMKGLALWLASDASSFVTGQILIEDGGYSA
jgi:NAD(P)-dependent dehydrogenase (short-subunit alcohol dehydrogenase family)